MAELGEHEDERQRKTEQEHSRSQWHSPHLTRIDTASRRLKRRIARFRDSPGARKTTGDEFPRCLGSLLGPRFRRREDEMAEHSVGTREEWQKARDDLAKLEAEQAKHDEEIKEKRLALPWVPVEKEYVFDTEDGKKTLAELFDGRSQLLAYNIMFGPDYTLGACPGCTNLGDGLDGSLIHVNHRDVTLLCFSRAPIERLTAYKQRMGWEFPYVSTYNTDFAFDFGLALTEEQAQEIPQVKEMIDDPPEWLQEWSRQIGAELKDGLREGPSWIAFARENGTVYHTYTVMAPDPFVAPYFSFLLDRTPMPQPAEVRVWRKDEYPD
jgi:predicted dithiol-disulfide oxidoreductase (DUF899 family)